MCVKLEEKCIEFCLRVLRLGHGPSKVICHQACKCKCQMQMRTSSHSDAADVASFLAPRGLRPLRSDVLSGLGCACRGLRSSWPWPHCSPSRRRILKRDFVDRVKLRGGSRPLDQRRVSATGRCLPGSQRSHPFAPSLQTRNLFLSDGMFRIHRLVECCPCKEIGSEKSAKKLLHDKQ